LTGRRVEPFDRHHPRVRHCRKVNREWASGRSVYQVLRARGRGLGEAVPGRTEGTHRSDPGQVELARVAQNVPEVVPKVVPARVGFAADAVDGGSTQVPLLARVMNEIRVHEQDLAAVREVLPGVVPVRLRRVVPHPEVAVVAVVDVDLAGGL